MKKIEVFLTSQFGGIYLRNRVFGNILFFSLVFVLVTSMFLVIKTTFNRVVLVQTLPTIAKLQVDMELDGNGNVVNMNEVHMLVKKLKMESALIRDECMNELNRRLTIINTNGNIIILEFVVIVILMTLVFIVFLFLEYTRIDWEREKKRLIKSHTDYSKRGDQIELGLKEDIEELEKELRVAKKKETEAIIKAASALENREQYADAQVNLKLKKIKDKHEKSVAKLQEKNKTLQEEIKQLKVQIHQQ
ncbi:MAG: hypothetical protein ABFQ53_03150 [Patescibacteria group bacterium]